MVISSTSPMDFLTGAGATVCAGVTLGDGGLSSWQGSPPLPREAVDAVVTASGLVYRSLKDGTGASPTASDKVKVHYRGTFPDGKEFDSSYKRNAPATFPLSRVVPCWTEGMQKIKVGGGFHRCKWGVSVDGDATAPGDMNALAQSCDSDLDTRASQEINGGDGSSIGS